MERPATLVRVSEHIEEIVSFIKRIMDRGYAYSTNSGVYFDMQRFTSSGHEYKMAPVGHQPEEQGKHKLYIIITSYPISHACNVFFSALYRERRSIRRQEGCA